MPVSGEIRDFELSSELLRALKRRACRKVLVLGGSDTGKTTLIAQIASMLAEAGDTVGLVDGDIGQSHIGPPTTVGGALIRGPFADWTELKPEVLSFVGANSPFGHLLPTLVSMSLVTGHLEGKARHLVIDTSGFISGPAAGLVWNVVDGLSPDLIIALARRDELEPILDGLPRGGAVWRMSVASAVQRKTTTRRTAYRREQYSRYFARAQLTDIALDGLYVRRSDTGWSLRAAELRHLLVSLRGHGGADLAIGIMVEFHPRKRKATILAPLVDTTAVEGIILGSLRLNPRDFSETRL